LDHGQTSQPACAACPDLPAYRRGAPAAAMDLESDEDAMGLLGWILVIFIVLVLFGFISVRIWT
jgi:hypothetical protein